MGETNIFKNPTNKKDLPGIRPRVRFFQQEEICRKNRRKSEEGEVLWLLCYAVQHRWGKIKTGRKIKKKKKNSINNKKGRGEGGSNCRVQRRMPIRACRNGGARGGGGSIGSLEGPGAKHTMRAQDLTLPASSNSETSTPLHRS